MATYAQQMLNQLSPTTRARVEQRIAATSAINPFTHCPICGLKFHEGECPDEEIIEQWRKEGRLPALDTFDRVKAQDKQSDRIEEQMRREAHRG